jgi:hypothetical protein
MPKCHYVRARDRRHARSTARHSSRPRPTPIGSHHPHAPPESLSPHVASLRSKILFLLYADLPLHITIGLLCLSVPLPSSSAAPPCLQRQSGQPHAPHGLVLVHAPASSTGTMPGSGLKDPRAAASAEDASLPTAASGHGLLHPSPP